MSDYKLPNLFLETFGIKVDKAYSPKVDAGTANNSQPIYQGITMVEELTDAHEISYLGTPILFPITFLKGTYKKWNMRGEIVDAPMQDFRLPAATIVDFKRSKVMSETVINAGYNEVNEISAFRSWEISFMGFFLSDPGHPQGHTTRFDQEREMVKWESMASSINVMGYLFAEKDINAITIKDISVTAQRGKPGILPFQIMAKADQAFELLIKNR